MSRENIHVYIRPHPNSGDFPIKSNSITISNQNFTFDKIFSPKASQEEIFDTSVIDNALRGFNSTIFVYGATSTGKTHTMFGKENDYGIIPRACSYLFSELDRKSTIIEFSVKLSFIEIYCENIFDLLTENSDVALRLRQNTKGEVFIEHVAEKYIEDSKQLLKIIEKGMKQRATSETALNSQSSRSHALLVLNVRQLLNDETVIESKIWFVDLAGSEDVNKSLVSGEGLLEAQLINKSLSSLGNVINALTEKGREHIPYRDSKLTYLLQNSLGGDSKTILIATIGEDEAESINTLKFARRAKNIQNIPTINRKESIRELKRVIEKLNEEIKSLKEKNNGTHTDTNNILLINRLNILLEAEQQKSEGYKNEIDRLKLGYENTKYNLEDANQQILIEKSRVKKLTEFKELVMDNISSPNLLKRMINGKI